MSDRWFSVALWVAALLVSSATGLISLQTRAMVAELRTEVVERIQRQEQRLQDLYVSRREFEASKEQLGRPRK